jgi:proteasome lid subunit RPN8/RPN11
MSKKINSFTLNDRTIERMKDMIDQTKKDKKEREFDLCNCTKNNVLFHMNECVGNECEVASRRICVEGEFVGTYHTHPQPFSEQPSTGDLFNVLREGMGCIGSSKTDIIKCYLYDRSKGYEKYKNTYEQLQKIDNIENDIVGESSKKPELWPEIARKLENLKEKNDVIDTYFRTVRII